jgi:fatty acid desaturase
MNEAFITDDPLSAERLRDLMTTTDGHSLLRMFLQCLFLVVSFVAFALAPMGPMKWAALLVHGVCHFAFFGLLHESCHRTAFTRRSLNTLGGWVAALSQPMSPALMQAFHFEHHRHTHDVSRDPELARLEFMVHWPRHLMWLATLTGVHLLVARIGWSVFAALVPRGRLWEIVLPFVKPDAQSEVAREARILVLIHGTLIASACTAAPALLWFYAGMAVGHACLGTYTICEHRGLPPGGTILERTRSINTTGILRWLLWNMPYHAVHHAWPAVPWHALPALHKEVRDHLPHKDHGVIMLQWHRGRD